jgi:hypothetical protein
LLSLLFADAGGEINRHTPAMNQTTIPHHILFATPAIAQWTIDRVKERVTPRQVLSMMLSDDYKIDWSAFKATPTYEEVCERLVLGGYTYAELREKGRTLREELLRYRMHPRFARRLEEWGL